MSTKAATVLYPVADLGRFAWFIQTPFIFSTKENWIANMLALLARAIGGIT